MTDLHSDTPYNATRIELRHSSHDYAESYAYGSIGPDNRHDVDWFKVDLIAGNQYQIKLTGGNPREPHKLNHGQISVYTQDGLNSYPVSQEIFQSGFTNRRGRVRLEDVVESGDYWIKVEGFEDNSSKGIGSYSVKVEQNGRLSNPSSGHIPTTPKPQQDQELPVYVPPFDDGRPRHTFKHFSVKRKRFNPIDVLSGPTRYGDTVKGSKKSDILRDGYGPDVLIGGRRGDHFYISAPDGFGSSNSDRISDFDRKDRIVLDDSLFDPRQKVVFATGLSRDKDAMSTKDFDVIYFEDTGELYLDANGSRSGYGNELEGGLMLSVTPLTNIGKRNIIVES